MEYIDFVACHKNIRWLKIFPIITADLFQLNFVYVFTEILTKR